LFLNADEVGFGFLAEECGVHFPPHKVGMVMDRRDTVTFGIEFIDFFAVALLEKATRGGTESLDVGSGIAVHIAKRMDRGARELPVDRNVGKKRAGEVRFFLGGVLAASIDLVGPRLLFLQWFKNLKFTSKSRVSKSRKLFRKDFFSKQHLLGFRRYYFRP
jgi:hypothetical protein